MLVKAKLFAFVMMLALVSACTENPKLEPISSDATVVAFGDSLTVGVGASESESYPLVLAEMSGINVIGSGVSGETTQEGLARLPGVLSQWDPDLVILLEGGNDILRNKNPDRIKANLAEMIELIRARGAQVVLLGVPEKRLFSDSAPLYGELAERYGLAYEDDIIASLLRDQKMKSDPIHFNAAGYKALAQAIYQLLQDEGAL